MLYKSCCPCSNTARVQRRRRRKESEALNALSYNTPSSHGGLSGAEPSKQDPGGVPDKEGIGKTQPGSFVMSPLHPSESRESPWAGHMGRHQVLPSTTGCTEGAEQPQPFPPARGGCQKHSGHPGPQNTWYYLKSKDSIARAELEGNHQRKLL